MQGSGFRVQGSGFRVQGAGFRVQGSGFRVQGAGLMEYHLARLVAQLHGHHLQQVEMIHAIGVGSVKSMFGGSGE